MSSPNGTTRDQNTVNCEETWLHLTMSTNALVSEDDVPHPPTKKTAGYYAALAIIIPVWAITPVSWIFLGVGIWEHGIHGIHRVSSPRERLLILWALLEVRLQLDSRRVVCMLPILPNAP